MEESKQSRGGFIFIAVIIVALVGLVGFLFYDKVLKKEPEVIARKVEDKKKEETPIEEQKQEQQEQKQEEKKEEPKKQETKKEDTKKEESKKSYKEYYVSYDENSSRDPYFIGCNNNDCDVIMELKDCVNEIGMYNKRYYFETTTSDTLTVKYIDFADNLKVKTWGSIKQNISDEMGMVETIESPVIVGDTMYFTFNSMPSSIKNGTGLLAIKMNASKLTDFKVIDKETDLGKWSIDKKNKIIYYINFYHNDPAMYKYDINTGKKEKILTTKNTFDDLVFVDGHLVYFDANNKTVNEVDTKTYKTSVIVDAKNERIGYTFGLDTQAYKDKFYVQKGGTIYKYDFSTKQFTKYVDVDPNGFEGFMIMDDNTIYVGTSKDPYHYYLVNGKKTSSLSNKEMTVNKNGKKEKVSSYGTKKLAIS